MFHLAEIRKATDGLSFDQSLVLADTLKEREPEILDLSPVQVTGRISHERDLYLLTYEANYTITLASSRSLTPVALEVSLPVTEVFIEQAKAADQAELVEEDLVLILESDQIDLEESVVDNILLNLPSRVLSPEEEASSDLPSGESWTLLTESQYQAQKAEEKVQNSPFASLSGLFDDGENQ